MGVCRGWSNLQRAFEVRDGLFGFARTKEKQAEIIVRQVGVGIQEERGPIERLAVAEDLAVVPGDDPEGESTSRAEG